MKKILTAAFAVTVAAAMIFTAAGCSKEEHAPEQIIESGKLTVCTDPNFAPFEFLSGGEVCGVDVEIAKAIAEELGVSLVIKEIPFDGIIGCVKDGQVDMAIAGLTITEERKAEVNFSNSYIESVQCLIMPEDSDIAHMEDLAGRNIAVLNKYTGQFIIEDEINDGVLKDADAQMRTFVKADEAILAMQEKHIDVMVMDEYAAMDIAAATPGLEVIPLSYRDGTVIAEEYGIAVALGEDKLLAEINEVIARLKEDGQIREWVIAYSK